MYNWRRIILIARRELLTRYAQKSFRAMLVVQIVLGLLAALSPIAISKFSGGVGNNPIVIVDQAQSGLADRFPALSESDGTGLGKMGVRTNVSSVDDAKKIVDDGDADMAIVVTGDPKADVAYELIAKNTSPLSLTRQRVGSVLSRFNAERKLAQSGVSPETASTLQQPAGITLQKPDGSKVGEESTSGKPGSAKYGVAYVFAFLSYFAIFMLGMWIAQGVVEEKASRIMEIMVNAATPRDLLLGKVLGILGAGLTLLIPMMAMSGTAFALSPKIADALNVDLTQKFDIDFADVSLKAIGAFLAFFLFGFLLYGALFAAIGSMVSRQEEVSQAVSPVMMLVIVGFFAAMITLSVPTSAFAKALMYIPLTSPYVAVPRVVLGNAGWGEVLTSLAILVVTSIAAMWLAGRIYRVGVLMYGQKPGMKSFLRLGRMQTVAR